MTATITKSTGKSGLMKTGDHNVATVSEPATLTPATGASPPPPEDAPPNPPDPARIDELLAEAKKLYGKEREAENTALTQRIEMGRVLNRLKHEVGHGYFMKKFSEWQALKQINFSLKTGQGAMAYAELEADGKFAAVSNLADAERVRKAEAAKKKAEKEKAEKREGEAEGQPSPGNGEDQGEGNTSALPKLKKPQIGHKVKLLAEPILKEFASYEPATKASLLEELIELLSEEYEKTTEAHA